MWTRLPPYPTLSPPFSYNAFNNIIYSECNPYTHEMKENKLEMKENKLSVGSLQRDPGGRRRNYSGIRYSLFTGSFGNHTSNNQA
ncbi:hypothetical protein HanXRQr2_Chr16g0759871 [Helianthus annuus]|uniref:Uncharacterized protein n=1 Tax=Helianthus annuus TaxID=4232 RepID=A0A251S1F3_HELAN|nr:hypothetical protein HanXRQr2_Chr16g0759871 [Helianthus annuus]KAJ0438928.1 hypothetical protein HanHA300_Chr16g0619581 [Helianthus annuus]KAJ0461281.1 hypothetical protein HanHA89_Chr16g0670491 [Helianthus annuus]KAJ0645594.1 hypothetical protein HanOQP8_Chr16g0625621 [Helianthus annuus]KAJ0822116.1 hypothetical protein HanPSC8_Chr16g0728161 [Helianthus annuus]